MSSARFAKAVMKRFESRPPRAEDEIGLLHEVFRHPLFAEAPAERRSEIMLEASRRTYEDEVAFPWDQYFGHSLKPLLRGRNALDLGCAGGGRSVAWFRRYELAHISGIDISDVYIDAAWKFARQMSAKAEFTVAVAEALPYPDERFDAILTFDVLEHVQDVEKALSECWRVLRSAGRLCLVFPSYFQPFEHHLGLATRAPFIQYAFPSRALVRAFHEILEERGPDAAWYKRSSPELEWWERGHEINGMTAGGFKKLIRQAGWTIRLEGRKPIGSIGRKAQHMAAARVVAASLAPLTRVPVLRELALHRVVYILDKP
jgi:SAM-dependent methyltransferase